jgi:hypothetical protein
METGLPRVFREQLNWYAAVEFLAGFGGTMLTKANANELYQRLTSLLGSLDWDADPATIRMKMGQAYALTYEVGEMADALQVRECSKNLPKIYDDEKGFVETALYRAIGRAEILATVETTSAYMAVGKSFDALAAISKVFREAKRLLVIVDPYADATFFTDFAVLAEPSIRIRIMGQPVNGGAFAVAAKKWMEQHTSERPLEARITEPRSLHDRLIFVDDHSVYHLSQSFNQLAARSPATLYALDEELLKLKRDHYEGLWKTGTAV